MSVVLHETADGSAVFSCYEYFSQEELVSIPPNLQSTSPFGSPLSSVRPFHPMGYAVCAFVLLALLLAALSSPWAVVKLLAILAKTPYHALRSIVSFLAPSLFYKSVFGEVCFVTGGASGIGKLVAQRLAKLGASVVLIDKDREALDQAVHDVRAAAAAEVFMVVCDLADREATYAAMRHAQDLAGPCTMLINNAGIVTGKRFLDGSDQLQELTMAVNATAHFWTVKSTLPAMLEADHGHIVTIASSAGMLGVAGLADYCASKAAALRFDESIRLEMRKLGKAGVHTTVRRRGVAQTWPPARNERSRDARLHPGGCRSSAHSSSRRACSRACRPSGRASCHSSSPSGRPTRLSPRSAATSGSY